MTNDPFQPTGPRHSGQDRAQTTAREDEVDPRIAATGGKPVRDRSGYIWPGMMDEANWRKTLAHKHTRSYSCAHCGQAFHSPAAVYTHMAKVHGK